MKTYRISFEAAGRMENVVLEPGGKPEKTATRVLEILALKDLLNFRSKGANLTTFNLCGTLVAQLDALECTAEHIDIDGTDLANLRAGFDASIGNGRPMYWALCHSLFTQIEKGGEEISTTKQEIAS